MGHTPPSADWTTLAWRQSASEKLEMATSIPTNASVGSAPEHLQATATSEEIEAAFERDGSSC
jgi:hypothetical protein